MNKSIKATALSLFIIGCIICAPAYGFHKRTEKEKPNYKPKNSQIWRYSDDKKEYIKEKNKKNSNIHEVSYKHNPKYDEPEMDLIFEAPFGKYRKFYDPDGEIGINFIKRPPRDFE